MKRILIVLVFLTWSMRGIAQIQIPDMNFFIYVPGGSNGSPQSASLGQADYSRVKLPFLPTQPTYTNWLEIYVELPPLTVDAWIVEKQKDGLLSPVAEVTNPVSALHFTLTTNQIYNLIQGAWYLKVDFGDSNYLANLEPQYAFANGPTATIVFPPTPGLDDPRSFQVVLPPIRRDQLVLDASHCTDPFYLPLTYSWTVWSSYDSSGTPVFSSTNVLAVHPFVPGTYLVKLQANDPIADGSPFYFYLQVVTAGQAIESLVSDFQSLAIPRFKARTLVNILSNAAENINRGDGAQGCNELEIYIRSVNASHFGSTLTPLLIQPAQNIIDAFDSAPAGS